MKFMLPRVLRTPARLVLPLLAVLTALSTGCGSRAHIRVETDPEGAALTCNGRPYPDTPHTLTGLNGGTYVLSARKAGCRETRQVVTIQDGQRVTVRMKLEPIQGLALVQSNPPGAEVSIDGAFRNRTPFVITDLPVGPHRFSFSAEGYLPRDVDVTVEDRAPRTIRADLPRNAGRLVVRSDPAGARVFINNIDRGVTPLDVDDAPVGETEVKVSLDGHEPAIQRVPLAALQTREVSVRLVPLPTQLKIVSLPEGARLYVNNEYRGVSPLDLRDVPAGEVRIRAEMRGYETMARSIALEASAPRTEEFRLAKNSGKLIVVTEPPNVKVFLNGEERGVTTPSENALISAPLEVDFLPPGTYNLQLNRPGYRFKPAQFSVQANTVVDRHEKMERLFVADTRVTMTSGVVRDGMLLKQYPNGKIDLQLETGTIISLDKPEIQKVEPAPGTRAP